MCGFVGYTGTTKDNKNVLSNMLKAISHRGPDSEDTYIDDKISLGFRRLSIIDLKNGSQPMFNEDKTKVLVFNGEIYNYRFLKQELIKKGHVFSTESDSEVLIHGYEEYGVNLLCKLRGMFSFVIWDNKEKKIFGARDFFGIKPFYYTKMGSTFMFGSEIKGFLSHPDFKKELFEEKLPDYLTFSCVPGNETFFKNVYKLPPAHYFEYRNTPSGGELKIIRYFTPEFNIENDKNMDYFVDHISNSVTESVTAHKISDVEVGTFLSSGVDSSYVTYELSKSEKIRTYSIGFDDKLYDESNDAKKFAQEISVQNYSKIVSSEEYFSNVGNVQYHLDEPLANPSANLLYFVSQLASKDVKVVLSGEGADEMFGGYNVYQEPLSLKNYQKLPLSIRKFLALLVKPLPYFKGKNFIIRGSKTIEERYIGNSNLFNEKERGNVLKNKYKSKSPQDYVKPFYDKVKNNDDITKMQYIDIHFWMVQEILLKADKMSMANSLELRVPFLDIEIFKLASTIPVEYKVNKKNTKLALREAAGKEINKISADRKKMAFPLPLVEWLREDKYYNIIKKHFLSEIAEKYFNKTKILRLLDEHRKGKNNSRKIWAIFTFLVWYEEFFIKR
ncbi:MAG: asparagine synthase (glutamine-hydrolyzing) [Patescibacteria group bacterium]|nr:asparagine synthase (glutamine-hydrolyzing) [Patescibacteria group bacterium]